jgi:hypothetical protein
MIGSLGRAQVQPVFIKSSPVWSQTDLRSRRTPFPFGLPENDVSKLIAAVIIAMNDKKFLAQAMTDRSATSIAKLIKEKVALVTKRDQGETLSEFTKQWLLAEGVCEFVRATCSYDHTDRERNQPAETQIAHNRFQYIYNMERPSAVCWGIAVSCRDIARAAGLHCDFVNGIARGLGSPAPKQSGRNHGIVVFTFAGGFEVPADVSSNICDFQDNRKPNPSQKRNSWMVLPRLPEAWELFLATFNADIGEELDISGDKQNRHKLLLMSFPKWAEVDTGYLKPLLEWLKRTEDGKS